MTNTNMWHVFIPLACVLLPALASCDRGADPAPRQLTQQEAISAFCNEAAAYAAADPFNRSESYMTLLQQKILEEEWDPDTVLNTCAAALNRKSEFMRRTTPQPAG